MHLAARWAGAVLFFTCFVFLGLMVLRENDRVLPQLPSCTTTVDPTQIPSPKWNPFDGGMNIKSVAERIEHFRFTLETGRMEDLNISSDVRRILRHEMKTLEEELGIRKWKLAKSRELSQRIVKTLDALQNPKKCDEARILYCMIPSGYGFGAGVQDLLWCAFNAYIRRRMLVMMVEKWEYAPQGWDAFFKPISQSCPYSIKYTHQKVFWDDWGNRTLLTSLPSDLEGELRVLGSNPLPWWYGQLLGYYLKPSTDLDEYIQGKIRELNYTNPIVGVHIRRSDKIGKEGAFHSVDEYMAQVEDHFGARALAGENLTEKRVFVSTDDPKALDECIQRYPEYRFIYNIRTAAKAENLTTRYSLDSVKEALLDIYLLAKSDFFIGTFSSGFSRLAYILMQYFNEDALESVYSLDVEFHYVGALNAPRLAVYDHAPQRPKDLSLTKDDVLLQPYIHSFQDDSIHGKIRDGFSWGKTHRAEIQGNYPLYKTKPVFNIVNVTES